MNFSTAEEMDQQKQKIENERKRKFETDRKEPHGKTQLAQTDGLKPIRIKKPNRPVIIDDDNEVIDLRRVRSLKDVSAEYE